ncbi:MAG: aminoacyl-tRNA hydrolase [Firmicutes bacterium]|nr:aminoacyl-tRNA hydrolase [Bacillota bacterium]
MKLIIGLGNPGSKYERTYHNLGFMAIDALCIECGLTKGKNKASSVVFETFINDEKVVFAKPQTFMNRSGSAVSSLMNKYGAENEDLIIIYDDIDLELGKVRIRDLGSAGTHNGMRDIISFIDSEDIKRIRIGVGRPPANIELKDFVLMNIKSNEIPTFRDAMNEVVDHILGK